MKPLISWLLSSLHFGNLILNTRILLSLLGMLTLSGCRDHVDQPISPWTVATWIIGDAFEHPESDLTEHVEYIESKAATQLFELSKFIRIDQRMGILTLNQSSLGQWHGLYGYVHQGWSLPLQFSISQRQGRWVIHHLPQFDRYKEMIQLVSPIEGGSELLISGIEDGAPWEGGLIGRDLQGRTLSAVPLVWTPAGVIIDGIALDTEANQHNISIKLGQSFKQRSLLAHASQASYQPHVAIALPALAPAKKLARLISWAEGSGAQLISLIVQSAHRGPALIYLARRTETNRLLNPQTLVRGTVHERRVHLTIQKTHTTENVNLKEDFTFERITLGHSTNDQSHVTDIINRLLMRARQAHQIHGLSLSIQPQTKVVDVISIIGLVHAVDSDIPITIAPPKHRRSHK